MCENACTRRWVPPTPNGGEGTLVQSTIRFAAGAGVFAASLLIVGPNPAQAVADKNGSGSDSRNDDRKSGSNRHGNRAKPSVPNLLNDVLEVAGNDKGLLSDLTRPAMDLATAGNDKSLLPDLAPPVMELTTAGSDFADLAIAQSIAPEGPITLRSATVEEEPLGVNASGAATPRSGAANIGAPAVRVGTPRSGSANIGAPAVRVGTPRVVVGNGRSPGLQVADADPVAVNPVAPEAAPAVPVAIEVTIAPPPLPPPPSPVERIQPPRLVFGDMGTAKSDTTTDPFFGLAGLLLIPAIGAALGYRQARAAQSVRGSGVRRSLRRIFPDDDFGIASMNST
jgi:hypothetical protein